MKYSDIIRADAAAGASAVRTSRQLATPALSMSAESPAERPKPIVHFSIEQKVGNAILHTGGMSGQEKDAQEAIKEAAARL